ncbi:MAG: DUF1254 domain-containing protein [Vulcanimicrobiaceae bacterium]
MQSLQTTTEALAKQAYIYGFPLVDLYRIMFGYFIDSKSPAYAGPFNELHNTARVYTPADSTDQMPNSDTPYSMLGLDLRAQPMVLTLPAIEQDRYYSVQFVDQYTFNIAYAGSRTTGNGGGNILLAGPNWQGEVPSGITQVIRFDTQFGLALIRTQLFGPSDLENVKKIQAGYAAQPLSKYLRQAAPVPAPPVDWISPLSPARERSSPAFFDVLAFVLQFCPVVPSEASLRQSFTAIDSTSSNSTSSTNPYVAGMAAGQEAIDAARAALTGANDLFGTRESMHENFLNRAVGAQYGILGNSAAEAVHFGYAAGPNGETLTGDNRYAIRFAKDRLPPVNAFWSLTMYDSARQLLVENPIDRYLINSPMLPNLKRDADGGLTLYIQHDSPGTARESNWLPAPDGPFFMVLRLYWPQEPARSGQWVQPPIAPGA